MPGSDEQPRCQWVSGRGGRSPEAIVYSGRACSLAACGRDGVAGPGELAHPERIPRMPQVPTEADVIRMMDTLGSPVNPIALL